MQVQSPAQPRLSFPTRGDGSNANRNNPRAPDCEKNKIKPQEQKRPEEWLQNPVGLSRVPITTQESQNMPVDDTDWLMHGQRIIRSVDAFLGNKYHDI